MIDPLFTQALEIYQQTDGNLKEVAERLEISEQRAKKILAMPLLYQHERKKE